MKITDGFKNKRECQAGFGKISTQMGRIEKLCDDIKDETNLVCDGIMYDVSMLDYDIYSKKQVEMDVMYYKIICEVLRSLKFDMDKIRHGEYTKRMKGVLERYMMKQLLRKGVKKHGNAKG